MARPLLVLVHGKDSTKETWDAALASSEAQALLGSEILQEAVCVDLHGHGDNLSSFLAEARARIGDDSEVDADAIGAVADDLQGMKRHVEAMKRVLTPLGVLDENSSRQMVLVGHSMGARVVAAFATRFPKSVRQLVLVDMDARERGMPRMTTSLQRLVSIPAAYPTFEQLCAVLTQHGYDAERCDQFRASGRIIEEIDETSGSVSFRTKVHPLVAALSHVALLKNDCEEDFSDAGTKLFSRVWLFVAGKYSAVSDAGLARCVELIPRANIVHFPSAGHSIHNHEPSRGLLFRTLAALILSDSDETVTKHVAAEAETPMADKDDYFDVKALAPPSGWNAKAPSPAMEKVWLLGEGDERAFLLRNVLTPEECEYFIRTAKEDLSITPLQGGTDYRNCDRTLCESRVVADVIFERLAPFIKDITVTEDDNQNIGTGRALVGEWKLRMLNDRFRICRYHAKAEGHFGPHFDGWVNFEDGKRSLKTFMIYLNGSPDFLGGTTNFLEPQELFRGENGRIQSRPGTTLFAVQPEPGMALIFNHQFLHEGSAVLPHASDATGLAHPNEKWIMRSDLMFENTTQTLTSNQKRALVLLQEAEEAESQKDSGTAQRLYRAAFKLDPELEEELFS